MRSFAAVFAITFLLISCSSRLSAQPADKKAQNLKLHTPTEDQVRITGGPWYNAMELERKYLRSLDPDRLLVDFRKTAGLKPNAKEYGGWEMESRELRGHTIGHYLSAISRMARLTNDSVLSARCVYTVKELNRCQQKIGTGYVSAFPTEYLDRVENLKEVWAPYYTLHKILAGLFDSYKFCSDTLALTTATNLVHYLYARTIPLGMEQFQKVLDSTEEGGMNEFLWNLYAETGDTMSRNLAQFFYAKHDFDPLKERKEELKGLHANSTIPIVLGLARDYEVTGDITRKQMSEYFWRAVVEGRTFVTGGTSANDLWNADPYHLNQELNPYAQESCGTYNLLKLSSHLWSWSRDIKYQEYMERALVNAILPSQHPVTGMSLYHLATSPGYYKIFSTPDSSFWCCTGTGMENFSRTSEYIYAVEDNTLYVNQFVPSELKYKNEGFRLIQETNMPDGKALSLQIICDRPVAIKLAIRIPSWTGEDYTITLNGKPLTAKSAPGSYLLLDRVWHSADKIAISFAPHLWFSLLPVTNKYVAFGYGPVVLVAAFDRKNVVQKTSDDGPYHGKPTDVPGITFDPETFAQNIQLVDKKNLSFQIKSDSGKEIRLMPFYKIVDQYYSIYLPIGKTETAVNKKKYDATDHK
ncbi:MAG: beta-L-arabinofuranosidase domain-containing protein [Chitinophagaceae bacterium]